MRDFTNLISLAKNNVITTNDLVANNIPKPYLKFAVDENIIEKIAHGVYLLKNELKDDLYVFQLKNSRIIFASMTSAYLHNMTTRDTDRIYASAPLWYNTSKIAANNQIIREKDEQYGIGITEAKTSFGNPIKCHDAERTVCDLFSPKFHGDKFVQVEVLKNYLQSKEKNLHKLFDYAKKLGVDEELKKRVEVLL